MTISLFSECVVLGRMAQGLFWLICPFHAGKIHGKPLFQKMRFLFSPLDLGAVTV